jgi:hypothetical protein
VQAGVQHVEQLVLQSQLKQLTWQMQTALELA